MTILFGHPTGGPAVYQTALAHFEAGRLERFVVPWMPSPATFRLLACMTPIRPLVQRLGRRNFAPLANAPKRQGRVREMKRLLIRALGFDSTRRVIETNEWLMRTMARECPHPRVTAVHSFEDSSLWQFTEARRLGKACIYNMPTPYYPARKEILADISTRYEDWLAPGQRPDRLPVSAEHKRRELALADIVIVQSAFTEDSIRRHWPDKPIARARYGVDIEFWSPGPADRNGKLRFIYAGQLSVPKGTPCLLEAWDRASLKDAELELIGPWMLADSKRKALPDNVRLRAPLGPVALRERYRAADVFVFPSFFEGFGMVLVEALACGLPSICSTATVGAEILTERSGRLVPPGSVDALVEGLRWAAGHRDDVAQMAAAARCLAATNTWTDYRRTISGTVAGFAG